MILDNEKFEYGESKFVLNKISEAIQNEQNANEFYKHAATFQTHAVFSSLIDSSHERLRILNEIYVFKTKTKFQTQVISFDMQMDFKNCVAISIREENNSLMTLLEIYDSAADESLVRKINFIMFHKQHDINTLVALKI